MKLEEKYLKRIDEECFLDYDDKKVEPDKYGEYQNLDSVANHEKADDILEDLLKELGYNKLIKKYQSVDKWYFRD